MKKKYLCVLLVALLLLAAMPLLAMATDGTGVDSEEALRSALEQGGEIVLTDNITLDASSSKLVIANGVTVTLDLAGYTLSQTKEQTGADWMIENKGTLTVQDSSENQTGRISYTDIGTGSYNGSHTIQNYGILNVEGGKIENLSTETVANNGWPHAIDTYSGNNSVEVNITGGTVYCKYYSAIRMYCNSKDKYTNVVNISDGNIMGAVDFHNPAQGSYKGELNISGGNLTAGASGKVLRLVNFGTDLSGMKATVTGGTFSGTIPVALAGSEQDNTYLQQAFSITGGSFTADPSLCVADGYIVSYEKGTYNVIERTGVAVDVTTEVIPGVSTGAVSAENTGITNDQVSDAVNDATTQQDLQNAAFNMQNKVSVVGTKEGALEALKRENPEATFDESAEVKVEVNPYLQMDIQQYQSEGETKTVTVEIDAKYTVVASSGTYSACVGEGDMKVTEPITITVPLPDGFVTDANTKVYVHHYKNGGVYTYEATVEETAEGYVATFVNPNGFSTFEISTSEESSIDPLPGFAGTNLALEAAIDIRFWIAKDLLNAPEGAYAKIVTSGVTRTVNKDQWMQKEEGGVTYYLISCTSMAAKAMCDEIQVTVCNAEGQAISQTLSYTIAQAIVDLHNTTNDANYKNLCVAMLNYGAAAQTAFKYNTDELATKYLALLAGGNG